MPSASPAPLPTFEVDKAGLAKLLARKGVEHTVIELVQNALDEDTSTVHITLERLPAEGRWRIVVEDDNPEGFKDLRHAYTLFAESEKKADPTKRGRFNLGEKLVIARCEEASIATTKGTIVFTESGRRMLARKRRKGSVFTGVLVLTDDEVALIEKAVYALIIPEGIAVTFNMREVPHRAPAGTFECTLRTEKSDDEGRLRPTTRKTTVSLYEPLDGEPAMLYEMGIPVVATGDRWHVDIAQKVPLNTDRDNVPPGYLKDVRAEVLNHAHAALTAEETKATWVTSALEDERVDADAVKAVVTGRYGDKAVISDPTDREANHKAASEGYTVVPGGALPRAAWANVRGSGALLPAGQVTPGDAILATREAGEANRMNPDHYPQPVADLVAFTKALGERLLSAILSKSVTVDVVVYNEPQGHALATYTIASDGPSGTFSFNYGRLGYKWFEGGVRRESIDLVIHELGHHLAGGDSHLDSRYYHGLTKLAGEAVMLAIAEPDFFTVEAHRAVAA